MGLLDQVGGISGLMNMVKNPAQLPGLVAQAYPGAVHTIGRMRLLQEISSRSSTLAIQCNQLLAMSLLAKADISNADIDGLNKIEQQMLLVARRLNNYPKTAGKITLEILASTYGISASHDKGTQSEGQPEGTGAGLGGSSAS